MCRSSLMVWHQGLNALIEDGSSFKAIVSIETAVSILSLKSNFIGFHHKLLHVYMHEALLILALITQDVQFRVNLRMHLRKHQHVRRVMVGHLFCTQHSLLVFHW